MGRTIQVYGFPSYVTAEQIKEYLEIYTGKDTVYAIEVKQPKNDSRVYAHVQFTTTKKAEVISTLYEQKTLNYGRSYLKVRERERDIVPKPRVSIFSLEATILHLGCQVSDDRFFVLWKGVNVVVDFGIGLRKLYFMISHRGVEYKLELLYESIWNIQLRRPRSLDTQHLIIQGGLNTGQDFTGYVFIAFDDQKLAAAPRIYEKPVWSSEDATSRYFRDTLNDQWVRATDFTPLCCIGQSSAMCLELPYRTVLPDIREYFPYYKEDAGQFILERGSTFSSSLDLVPYVGPPQGSELPFNIIFKINILVQTGCITGPALDASFFRLVDPRYIPIAHIEDALEKLNHVKDCCYEPANWLSEHYKKYYTSKRRPKSPSISLDDGLVYVRRVQITPTKVYFCGPEVNMSNRVLRHYREVIENFIRISFVDENSEKMFSTDLSPRATSATEDRRHTGIYRRVLSTVRNGVVIGDKKFDFLAFSSSQLRENSAWMFASNGMHTAASIREWMGDFRDIRNVARYAARLGQSFGSSTETLSVGRHEVEHIPDVEIKRNGIKYVFSDGIGKISAQFARQVAIKCGLKGCTPSAFQIRYAGFKGVVAVDPLSSTKLSLRESMRKFASDNTKLDVLTWSKFQPCFLNRQVITLLSTLGVQDYIFEKKQKEAVNQLDMVLTDPLRAYEALEIMSSGENTIVLKEMLLCGYKPNVEPFLSIMLQMFRAAKLLELRTKSRIIVPNGRSMIGCLDESRTLDYGQVFVQFSLAGRELTQQSSIVKGKVVVAKNPCLHPGDVRVLWAVDVPALHHMVDCVVFPQKGTRPHPNECSGSDLDGDIYFVSWDPEIVPPRQIKPMDYIPAPIELLDHDVEIEEVEEYFTNYMVNDSLGIIANTHTAFADKESNKAESEPCKELAELFSIAVDFPKTGVPAKIPPHLRVKEYPDFMEKPDKPTYESHRVIGKLFRAVKDIVPHTNHIKSFTREIARRSYDPDMEVDGFDEYLDDACYYKGEYDYKLGNLMDYYGVKTEAEILGGNIMKMSKSFDRRKDAEAIALAVNSLKKEVRSWFNEKKDFIRSDTQAENNAYAKASAWYHVTYHPDYWGRYNEGMDRDHFLSFPWCVYDKLVQIKKKNNCSTMQMLENQLYGLRLR
ncbi:hypothetical protein GIB67_036367 [Kingdonia uniflora]|uniref:RNA-dependent RNA polymerase n=1 Tax=Kingdonia uniflora TaxID=39325 RepID=A0A7J7L3Y4_9MAGN|nr:hypothetical protein GIB67_036367 [Kingdonia uniflora]